jgi:hypothetical protein
MRWSQVAKRYRHEIIAMKNRKDKYTVWKREAVKRDWMNATREWWNLKENAEFIQELEGIVEIVDDPSYTLDDAKMGQLFYEHGAQGKHACAGVLWSMPHGTVIHGRNMDYQISFQMADGRILDWPDITFEATFYRNKKPIIKATMYPGAIGFHTAMLLGGWSFNQNSRDKNYMHQNLRAAMDGAVPSFLHTRRIMQSGIYDFKEAVSAVSAGRYIAPQYFIMSGAHAHEGVVLTVDRAGKRLEDTPAEEYLNSRRGQWYLVQTNDDLNKLSNEPRRPLANQLLASISPQEATYENMEQFMHTTFLFNPQTVFTTVMVPATGYFKTILPSDPPTVQNGERIMFSGGGEKLIKKIKVEKRKQ